MNVLRPVGNVLSKCVIEKDRESGEILVMLPDGTVEGAASAQEARAVFNRWAKRAVDPCGVRVDVIDWRGFQEHEVPK